MLGNLLGQPGYGQATQNPLLDLAGLNNNQGGLVGGVANPLTGLLTGGLNNNQGGLLGGEAANPLAGLLSGGIKCTQNEQRLLQEKQQRNLLRKYLTLQTGDPIQSSLISNTIPGRGALDDFDIGLGTRSSILSQLGIQDQPKGNNLLGTLGGLSSLAGGNNSNLLGLGGNNSALSNNLSALGNNLSSLGTIANLANSKGSNTGLLSSLVSLAKQPNNNGNILSNLGGLGTGLLGNNASSGSGLLGSLQSGVNTLNTLNKVNNAVNSVKGLFA